jgi:hypothetical protein
LRIPDHSIRAEAEAAVRQARYGLMLLNASLERRRPMLYRPSDDEVRRQILGVFMRRRIPASGILQRNNFFDVRDGDFQRGINKAVANNSITIDLRNRYRYQLTETGYAVRRMIDPVPGTMRHRHFELNQKGSLSSAKGTTHAQRWSKGARTP